MAGTILPALFPDCKKLTQVGSFRIKGDVRQDLGLCSPDGLITTYEENTNCKSGSHGADKDMAVEIKCPMGEVKHVLPVHYKVPIYYITQLLFEMFVLDVEQALYITYSKASTVVLLVTQDKGLWDKIWGVVKHLYDRNDLNTMRRCVSESKEILDLLRQFQNNNCHVLLEVPSKTSSEGIYHGRHQDPIRHGLGKPSQIKDFTHMKLGLVEVCQKA